MLVRPALVFTFALALGGSFALWRSAQAQEAPAPAGQDLLCRVFAVDPNRADGARIHTGDTTEEVGQWVSVQREEGWQPWSVDFELGVKGNGFPVAFTQVCLSRSLGQRAPLPR